ncbi:MAG: hypothetical protein FD167_805 [bacterium]|nr:MAG: hypothetical protein FD167_805 [bacterium]
MTIWEYKVEKVKLPYKSVGKSLVSSELDLSSAVDLLAEAGQRGWELVSSWQVNPHSRGTGTNVEVLYTFKRPKEEASQYDPLWK